MENNIEFKLFISGMSVKSMRAIENIKSLAEEYCEGCYKLEIIDVGKEKEKASHYQLFALPTLIKCNPKPMRTLLGDLSNKEKILKLLNIG